MTKKRFSLRTATIRKLASVIGAAMLLSVSAFAQETAWDLLSQNKQDAARSAYQSALDSGGGEEALRGLLLTAWSNGDSPEMAKILTRLATEFPDSPYTPAYLSLWGGSEFHGWKTRDRIQALETGIQKSASLPHRQQLAYELTETLDMLLDDGVETAARSAGILLDGWAVAGPFGQCGASDFFRPLGPETGFSAKYAGWKGEVEFKTVERCDKTGLVELDSLIQPDTGVAYSVNVVESEAENAACLTVSSPAAIQVWWNGAPVFEKAHYFLHTAKVRSAVVPIKTGKNLLVVKSQKTSPVWWIRASLQARENAELKFHSIPFQWSDFSSMYLTPFNVASPRSQESIVEESLYPFPIPDSSKPDEQMARKLLTAVWRLDRGECDKARQTLLDAQQQAPQFSLPYMLFGDCSLRLAEERSGSKPRFQQEAETALRRALELDPLSQPALVGLVTYFLDRDQADQALDFLNQHIEKNPAICEGNRSNLIDYTYGILYAKKSFDTDAAAAIQKSQNGWMPSYETYRLLFDHTMQNKNSSKASELLGQALNEFPAYLPFLERAGRLPDADATVAQALGFLRQAMLLHPDRLDYSLLLGELLEKTGKTGDARALYGELLQQHPNHPHILQRQAALDMLEGKKEDALTAYQKAYDVDPKSMQPFRALRDAGGKRDFPYQKYDAQLTEVDISQADRWNDSRASVIYYLDIMVLDIHNDGTYDQYIHQALKIMNQQGMEKWAEIVIPKGGEVEILMARTTAPDGTQWDVSNVQNLNDQQSLSMYGVQPGAVIEYAYIERAGRNEPGANYSGGGYFFGSDDDPMLLSKLTIVKPETTPLHLALNPQNNDPQITKENGKDILTWEKRMADGLKPERFAPSLSQRVPSVQWSTCPNWLNYVERQRLYLWGYEESSPVIDNLAQKFQAETSLKKDYVQKVFDYVQNEIEETSSGFTTADAAILGAGGKYQKVRLARQLLRKAGVETQLAITLDNEQDSGYRPIPVLSYPGSLLLFVPRQDGITDRIFLDFGSQFAPLGSLDPGVRKLAALVYDATAPYIEPVDPLLWDHGLIDRHYRMQILDDRSARIDGYYLYDNQYDRQIREALTNPEVKQRLSDSQLANDLRGVQVEKSDIVDLENLSKPPRMTFTGAIPDVAKPADERTLKINSVQVRTNASEFISEPTRAFRIEFPSSPVWDPLEIRLDMSTYLDRGASILLPQNVFLLSEFGFYSLFYEWNGKELIVRRSFLIPKQRIETSAYDRFIEFCRTIDQSEDRDILIKLPSSS